MEDLIVNYKKMLIEVENTHKDITNKEKRDIALKLLEIKTQRDNSQLFLEELIEKIIRII